MWTVLGALSHAHADVPSLQTTLKSVVSVLPEWPPNANRTKEPEGSGVVVIDGKTIITALHVVDKALSIRVRTSNGVIMQAKMKGRDKVTDLALLTVETELPVLPFGGDALLGDTVCAIGNAFGLGLSVTCGTVSAVNRSGMKFYAIEDFVQTDAAVNPGASGGALIDAGGNLIGIVSAIFTNTDKLDANIGVNFAIAAPLAERIAEQIYENGSAVWRGTGAALADYPRRGRIGELAAEVKHVRQDTPAETAGLEKGDRIVIAGGRRIRRSVDFKSIMARQRPGNEVIVTVRRGDATRELKLTVK